MKQSEIEAMKDNEKILRQKIAAVFGRGIKKIKVTPSRMLVNGIHRVSFEIHTNEEMLKGTLEYKVKQ